MGDHNSTLFNGNRSDKQQYGSMITKGTEGHAGTHLQDLPMPSLGHEKY
jgi:hypothetical protein